MCLARVLHKVTRVTHVWGHSIKMYNRYASVKNKNEGAFKKKSKIITIKRAR